VPDAETASSFEGPYRPARVLGPARLVRLTTLGGVAPEGQFYRPNNPAGDFWFPESSFLALRRMAEADLRRQAGPRGLPAGVLSERIRMYLRHELRARLAVRRNWTPSFDQFARMTVPPGGSVIALVGKVRRQPVYSPEFVGEPAARELERKGLNLPGGLTQYVIRLDFKANDAARSWIQAGLAF
jgi:hypothetical protein